MAILRNLVMLIVGMAALYWLSATYFAAYPQAHKTEQIRYRITATIDTPNGPRTGSGVWGYRQVPVFDIPAFSFKWYYTGRVEGEAIPIDLGDGRTAYVVLGGRTMPQDFGGGLHAAQFNEGFMNVLPLYNLASPPDGFRVGRAGSEGYAKAWIAAAKAHTAPVQLDCGPVAHHAPSSDCPAIVIVHDAAGHTIEMLDPLDYAKTLGSGFRLRGMTLRVVEDPITHGIAQRLLWVRPATYRDKVYSTLADRLRRVGFSRADETVADPDR